jgi:hypothetical protein
MNNQDIVDYLFEKQTYAVCFSACEEHNKMMVAVIQIKPEKMGTFCKITQFMI